ncbi:uncharacterized protein LOC134530286 [Bacillus rossius redtenbacheri]|uniref:uncharacterized protein LOC134530286 n=1 Tax=Bacillus rossius redtenbacheri TaxID=93214 RepID=UPI002FDE2BC2
MARRIRGRNSFQPQWKEEFPWLQEVDGSNHSARCSVCRTIFSVESMGRTAVVSHSSGNKHKLRLSSSEKSTSLDTWTTKAGSVHVATAVANAVAEASSVSSLSKLPSLGLGSTVASSCEVSQVGHQVKQHTVSTNRGLSSYLKRDEVTRAETLWCLQTVMNHDSLRGAASSVSLFKRMFPDDYIANSMQLQKDKISYVIVYGLSPYFHSELKTRINSCDFFSLGFDESMNKVAQKQQMDLSARFWDISQNRVCSRYVTSVFLHHTTAEDLLKAIKAGLEDLDFLKIIQLSMDGPNVNFKLLKLLAEDTRSFPDAPQFLDIGSCGLHTVHNAFKTGIKKTCWDIMEFFRALYYLFKEAPGRRGDYTQASGSNVFPLKVCSIRWVENGRVAKRAREMLPHVDKYISSVKGTAKEPTCRSFSTVSKAIKDNLLTAKIAFFEGLAENVEEFLKEFQCDAPMAPFLYDALTVLVKHAMTKIVKKNVLESTSLQKIDVLKQNESNSFICLKDIKNVDLGYGTRLALGKCKNVSEKDILLFRKDCRTALQHFVVKLMQKSPLKYPLTKALNCLNPCHMSTNADACKQLTSALEIVLKANLFSATTVERADREYKVLCSQPLVMEDLKTYSRSETRLDAFWMKLIDGKKEYENLVPVVKLLLTVSHGNAPLERGFSVNKEILVENMKETSVIAQRRIYDHVTYEGGLMKLDITKPMILSVRNAHCRYTEALNEQRQANADAMKLSEANKRAAAELRELKEKKRKLIEDAEREVSIINERVKELQK